MNPLNASPPEGPSEPQPEEHPIELEEFEAPQSSPKPTIKTNMVAHAVRVKVTGARPGENAGERELFIEETTSVLVIENGGVIRLSAAVAPGQLLFLSNEELNQESKREVVAQVKRKRTYRPTNCYVELEFAEPAPRFWGMEFSSATALLPKDAQEAEAAALVISAETTADEPGEPPAAPTLEEVQALKREVEALREQMKKLMQTPAASEQAPALAPASVPDASPAPAVGDVPRTESNANSGSDEAPGVAFTAKSLPIDHDPVPNQLLLPKPSLDFTMSLPKAKLSFRARGSFTPGFRAGALRLALLTTALVITAVGAAWNKHWIPWKSAAKKPSVSVPARAVNAKTPTLPGSQEAAEAHSESSNTKVASGAPVTSPGTPSQSAALPNTPAPEAADAAESAAQPSASGESVSQPAVRRTPPSTTLAGKRSTVRPTAEAAVDSVAPSAVESVIVPPKLIKSVRAVASVDALRDFETGNVVIDAVVGTTGEVTSTNVLSGPPSLRDSAVETLKQYRYEPATQNGQPVPAHVTVTIHFRFER
ncbi:MAG: energy transducer TonB [Candidatus Acidiferrales bacterium]